MTLLRDIEKRKHEGEKEGGRDRGKGKRSQIENHMTIKINENSL
jgi:hypothetical protein